MRGQTLCQRTINLGSIAPSSNVQELSNNSLEQPAKPSALALMVLLADCTLFIYALILLVSGTIA